MHSMVRRERRCQRYISNVACYARERAKRLQVVPFFNDDQIGRTCDIIILLSSNMRRRRPLPAAAAAVSDLLLIIRLITP